MDRLVPYQLPPRLVPHECGELVENLEQALRIGGIAIESQVLIVEVVNSLRVNVTEALAPCLSIGQVQHGDLGGQLAELAAVLGPVRPHQDTKEVMTRIPGES